MSLHKRSRTVVIISSNQLTDNEIDVALFKKGYTVEFYRALHLIPAVSIRTGKYRAVIVDDDSKDSLMPSGYHQVRSLKLMSASQTSFIFIASYNMETVQRAVDAGFDEYLAKPVSAEEIISVLKKMNKP